MLKRDFTKSNKDYFFKNRIVLIFVAVFLLIGILVASIFGMNGNFELNGYNEFTITVTESKAEDFGKYHSEINKIINSYDGKFDNMSIAGEGDNTKFVVRYLKDVKDTEVIEINKLVAEKLDVNIESVSSHVEVGPIVKNADYVYTAVAILILILVATIFAYVRYNGASAMSIIISSFLGTLAFMSLGAILQLSIGMSYFAMLVILNLAIIYTQINMFESMHRSGWMSSGDYGSAIENALNSNKFRTLVLTFALMVIGVLLVLFMSSTVKYIALNIMFMAVVVLAVTWYVVPFVWSVFITHCRKREYKIKASTENKKEN